MKPGLSSFHLTPSGPKPCSASKKPCRYGGKDHYASSSEAWRAFEAKAGGGCPPAQRRGTPPAEASSLSSATTPSPAKAQWEALRELRKPGVLEGLERRRRKRAQAFLQAKAYEERLRDDEFARREFVALVEAFREAERRGEKVEVVRPTEENYQAWLEASRDEPRRLQAALSRCEEKLSLARKARVDSIYQRAEEAYREETKA